MASHKVDFKIPLKEIPRAELSGIQDFPVARGGFGDVWKCIWSTSSSDPPVIVAIKAVRVPSSPETALVERIAQDVRREAYVWAKLKDDHILSLHGITTGFGDFPAFVSSWMTKGSLDHYLQQEPTLSTPKKLDMSRQIASGLKYLHEKGIVHGNLTPVNILINSDDKLCLADFGHSVILAESKDPMFDFCYGGNVRWMAPEILHLSDSEEGGPEPTKPTKPGDVFAYGCITLELLCGQQPYFPLVNAFHVIAAIAKGEEPFPQLTNVDESHTQYFLTCVSTNSNVRPKVQEIVAFIEAELQKF